MSPSLKLHIQNRLAPSLCPTWLLRVQAHGLQIHIEERTWHLDLCGVEVGLINSAPSPTTPLQGTAILMKFGEKNQRIWPTRHCPNCDLPGPSYYAQRSLILLPSGRHCHSPPVSSCGELWVMVDQLTILIIHNSAWSGHKRKSHIELWRASVKGWLHSSNGPTSTELPTLCSLQSEASLHRDRFFFPFSSSVIPEVRLRDVLWECAFLGAK